jgi:hypothetical protein
LHVSGAARCLHDELPHGTWRQLTARGAVAEVTGAYGVQPIDLFGQFALASLDNVRHALAGLFALLVATNVIAPSFGYQERNARDGTAREAFYPGHIFTLMI